mgnify:CR=1 FL=1
MPRKIFDFKCAYEVELDYEKIKDITKKDYNVELPKTDTNDCDINNDNSY